VQVFADFVHSCPIDGEGLIISLLYKQSLPGNLRGLDGLVLDP
jgi:hypothetical protein